MKYHLMGIVVENRSKNAPDLQEILTQFGCIINLRIGFHENGEKVCLNEGLIILELADEIEQIEELQNKLNKINGLRVKCIDL